MEILKNIIETLKIWFNLKKIKYDDITDFSEILTFEESCDLITNYNMWDITYLRLKRKEPNKLRMCATHLKKSIKNKK